MKNIYIHIPFCLKKCFYCSFPVLAVGKTQDNLDYYKDTLEKQYMSYLLREMNVTFDLYQDQEVLSTVYVGGGTPSLLSNNSFLQITSSLNNRFNRANAEFTIECDPGTFDREKLQFYNDELDVNRLSIGVQSFSQEMLQKLNRSHNINETLKSFKEISNVEKFKDFKHVSMDLLINMPHQVCIIKSLFYILAQHLDETFEQIKLYMPGHISVYSLQVEPGSNFYDQKKYREGTFPCPTSEVQEIEYLRYNHYEVSNYSLGEKLESKHNKCYWAGDIPFYGFGMGASSLQKGFRINRPKNLKKYFQFVDYLDSNKQYPKECIENENSEQERVKVKMLGNMRTKQGLHISSLSKISSELCIESKTTENQIRQFFRINQAVLKNLVDYKVLAEEDKIRLQIPNGFLVCDEIIAQALSYEL